MTEPIPILSLEPGGLAAGACHIAASDRAA